MKYLTNVPYLEVSDFRNNKLYMNGNKYKNKYVIVLLQGVFCGWCTKAKPDFSNLLKDKGHGQNFVIATIQSDEKNPGKEESAKGAVDIVKNMIKNQNGHKEKDIGFPTYAVFNRDGSFREIYEGDRDTQSISNYLQNISQ
jgi:formate hydrogenlyase subunit 6/NADH:ubiquinone oxidoreductase subunit I